MPNRVFDAGISEQTQKINEELIKLPPTINRVTLDTIIVVKTSADLEQEAKLEKQRKLINPLA